MKNEMEGRYEGKRPRGRKRRFMLDNLKDERSYEELKRIAQDRQRRRQDDT